MRDFPIDSQADADLRKVEAKVERCCGDLGLVQAMKDTLAKYPGCIHWHYKKKGVSGTLEVTLWPYKRQLWLTIQEGRRAESIEEELPKVKQCLSARRKDPDQNGVLQITDPVTLLGR